MTRADLSDYVTSQIESPLARVPGVGEVQVFGTGYSMRLWLDPGKLTKYGMTTDDVVAAVRSYNVEVSAGQFGGAPAVPGQRLNASILVQSLLVTPEEFAAIPLRHERGRLGRAGERRRPDRARDRDPRHRDLLQRPAGDGLRDPPGGGSERARHRRRGSRRRWTSSRSSSRPG